MIRSSANGNSLQTARGIAAFTFEKSVASKVGCPCPVQRCTRAAGPYRKSRKYRSGGVAPSCGSCLP
jgi:hypothetical protein